VRQSNILIICFVFFILAFLGYSLWQSKADSSFFHPSKEQQAADMKMAEKYLHDAEPERSLPIIHQHKEEMEKDTSEGKRWLNLFVEASSQLHDIDQLLMIYHFKPESFINNEKASLQIANAFVKNKSEKEYHVIHNSWKNRESKSASWTLLEVDALLHKGQKQQALEILKKHHWSGKEEDERLMRLAILNWHENPQETLEILNAELAKDPKNPEIRILRGKIYESQNKIALAELEFNTIANENPQDIYLQDQLAEFYRRQKNYSKALAIWQKQLSTTTNDHMWVKSLFWNRVTIPTTFDWKKVQFPEESHRAFLVYLLGLKPGQFWNQNHFEKLPNRLDDLHHYQATYWLRLLQALKTHDESLALTLLNNNHFENTSWAPLLELTLHRVLNYRKHGSLLIDGDVQNAEPLLKILTDQNRIPSFYREIDNLAQQEANEGASFKIPVGMQSLLCNQEIFTTALFAEGWNEAALQLYPMSILSSDFPEWVPALYINALRQNHGNQAALNFANLQKQTPIIALLKAEINIAEGKTTQAISDLEKLKSDTSDIGAKAVWLLSLIDMQNNQYRKASESIESHPQLSQTLQAQEALGRIAVMEGNLETAAQIYERIVNQSTEAKSFLARRAYQQKNWSQARQLTEDLLSEFPGNTQLQENLKKIIAQEEVQHHHSENVTSR